MNKWSNDPSDWFEGDPIFGIGPDGKFIPTWTRNPSKCERATRREDAIFATIEEVIRERQPIYLDSLQRHEGLSTLGRSLIELIISSPHKSDCAAAMEMERARWEERQYKP